MEIEATIDCEDGPHDCDEDALLEMDQLLEQVEEESLDDQCAPILDRKRFDLCLNVIASSSRIRWEKRSWFRLALVRISLGFIQHPTLKQLNWP